MNFTIFAVLGVVLDPAGVWWFSEGSDHGLSTCPSRNILETKSILYESLKNERRDLSKAGYPSVPLITISGFWDFQF